MSDPISGTWATGDGNFLYLKFDGQRSLAGVVTVGGRNNIATVKEGSFDPATCGFYAATGGENIVDAKGKKELGNFIWRDLPALSRRRPE